MTRHLIDRNHNMNRSTTLARYLELERRACASERMAVARMRVNRTPLRMTLGTRLAFGKRPQV